MTNNYLKSLLDKNTQAQSIVEPLLKSRFEVSNEPSYNDGFAGASEREDASIQKRHPIVEGSSEEKNSNISHEHQTKFLNTAENHFLSSEHKGEENIKESMEPMLSKSRDVDKEFVGIPIHTSNNNKESKSYGMLNKPVKNTIKKEKGFNVDHFGITDNNAQATPIQPFIKISIGRVEVKAVKPSEKMPVKPKTKPNLKLSLEDYIDKRK